MLHHQQYTIRSLVNHLSATLAAGNALLKAQGTAADPHSLLRFELTAITHILQAREDLKELQVADKAFRHQVTLFLTVTECLEETIPPNASSVMHEAAAVQLIGGRVAISTLMALTTAMHNSIALCLTASDGDATEAEHQQPTVTIEALVWTTSTDCI